MLESKGSNFEAQLSAFSRVVIGDENSADFRPHIRITKWGEESYIAFGPDTTEKILPDFDGSKIDWSNGDILYRFRVLEAAENREDGGFEFELHLAAMPLTPTLVWPVSITGLDLFQQPELSEFEMKRGNFRRPGIIGGFECYHQTKGGLFHIPGDADKYKTGKAFDLERPLARDANGKEWYLDWTIDKETGQLEIVIGLEFLTAAYPVVIDPTIGYTSLGASLDNTDNYMLSTAFTASGAGTTATATFYAGVKDSSSSTTNTVVGGIFTSAAGLPTSLLSTAAVITVPTNSGGVFYSATLTPPAIVDATVYHICVNNKAPATGIGQTYYTNSGGTSSYKSRTHANDLPNPFGTPDGDWSPNKISAYVDYTASTAALPAPYKSRGQSVKRSAYY